MNEFKNLNLKFDHLYNNDLEFKSQETDAKKFILKVKRGSIIFVDDYRLGNKWEKIVTKKSKKLIGICDDYKKKHYVDFLINTKPLLDIKHKKIYQNIKQVNKKNCKFLFGHKYAFIKKFSKQVNSDRKNFKITFYNGGSGDLVIYLKLIKLIIINKRLIDKIIQIKVIIGPMSKNKKKTVEIFSKINGIKIISDKLDIREQLVRTDLLISSSGLMFYESSYYKIPTIFIKMVDNQDIDNYSVQNFGQIVVLDKKDLNQYSDYFIESIRARASDDGNIVYLSSGWDSTSILAVLVHLFGKSKTRCIIGKMIYSNRTGVVNQFEIDRAKLVADYFGVRLDIIDWDYTKNVKVDVEEVLGNIFKDFCVGK